MTERMTLHTNLSLRSDIVGCLVHAVWRRRLCLFRLGRNRKAAQRQSRVPLNAKLLRRGLKGKGGEDKHGKPMSTLSPYAEHKGKDKGAIPSPHHQFISEFLVDIKPADERPFPASFDAHGEGEKDTSPHAIRVAVAHDAHAGPFAGL